MSLYKNESIFPEFMKIELCDELIDKINNVIEKYKKDTSEAVIYSMIENKTIKSDRRVSHKKSFHSDDLKYYIDKYVCPLIYCMLKKEHTDTHFDIMIGTQAFDYIKYDNGGYFDKHKDFVRVNNNMTHQYSMLIGLTKDVNNYSRGGNTILWLPVDDSNKDDYEKLINFTKDDNLDTIIKKYNLPNNIETIKKLLQTNNMKYIPYYVNCFGYGKSLLFKSDIVHSGEEFYNIFNMKELLMITLNITGVANNNEEIKNLSNYPDKINQWLNKEMHDIIIFDKFEYFMCKFAEDYKLIPFQIIIATGEYNNSKFNDIYIRYLNLQNKMEKDTTNCNLLERINTILVEIYEKTKKKLNKRGREYHINSEILEESSDISILKNLEGIQFNTNHIICDDMYEIKINNYVNNYYRNNYINNNNIVSHKEKINNTWEESSCNDDGDEYDETTYLNCNIDIKFCFMK